MPGERTQREIEQDWTASDTDDEEAAIRVKGATRVNRSSLTLLSPGISGCPTTKMVAAYSRSQGALAIGQRACLR